MNDVVSRTGGGKAFMHVSGERCTRKSLKKTGILPSISLAISDESAIKDIFMESYICNS